MSNADQGAVDFFKVMHLQFDNIISEHRGSDVMLSALLSLAFASYEGTVDLQTGDSPQPDCRKGCATCCTIRVVATAPEVFLVARYIRAREAQFSQQGLNMRQRLAEADEVTRASNESERVSLRRTCPYIYNGVCVIYPVRPLACRSHISYSRQACIDAAAGRLDEIPYSTGHMKIRSLVQNALQSALRDASYPWASYELNHAVSIALADEAAEQSWLTAEDVLQAAEVNDVSRTEMEAVFDHIHDR